ncbi:MAG: citrate lyase beta subunit [Candidatus Gottesmanbacteria bacterium]
MTLLEKKLIETLQVLKNTYGAIGVKAEFEAEGSRREELLRLKDIMDKAGGLTFTLKIGGAEAVTDLYDAILLGADYIVAPMIESSYALKKYIGIIKNNVTEENRNSLLFGINIETIHSYYDLQNILQVSGIEVLKFITIGRVDLSSSLGIPRDEINNEQMFLIVSDILTQVKKKGLECGLGGGIAKEALPFIKRLSTNLLNRYETRKIVFSMSKDLAKAEKGILLANEFEVLWLENKREYYGRIFREDDKRIDMIRKRFNK